MKRLSRGTVIEFNNRDFDKVRLAAGFSERDNKHVITLAKLKKLRCVCGTSGAGDIGEVGFWWGTW
ncbi:MAG: hypothetical protein ACLPY5_07350 [Candidatus Bathyarchaeia archaeon]